MSGRPANLTPWEPKQRIGAAHLQEAWDMLRRVATIMGWDTSLTQDRAGPPPLVWRLGRISTAGPAGEVNYVDARYWVREVYIKHGADPRAPIIFADYQPWDPGDGGDMVPVIHTVTNLPELPAGTHNLLVDTPVFYASLYDMVDDANANSRPNVRRIMFDGKTRGEFIGMDETMVTQQRDGWDWDTLHSEL